MSGSGWGFAPGDEITRDLVAVKRLGGGSAYEAYLAFDEVTYAPVKSTPQIVPPAKAEPLADFFTALQQELVK